MVPFPRQHSSSWIIHCYTRVSLKIWLLFVATLRYSSCQKHPGRLLCRDPCRICTLRHPPLWRGMCVRRRSGTREGSCVCYTTATAASPNSNGMVHGCLKPKLETWAEKGHTMLEHQMKGRRNLGTSKEFVSINVRNYDIAYLHFELYINSNDLCP